MGCQQAFSTLGHMRRWRRRLELCPRMRKVGCLLRIHFAIGVSVTGPRVTVSVAR